MPKKSINKFRGIDEHIQNVLNQEPVTVPAAKRQVNILDTPGPYDQAWLDANGLVVVYTHGRAVLQYRK